MYEGFENEIWLCIPNTDQHLSMKNPGLLRLLQQENKVCKPLKKFDVVIHQVALEFS